MILADKIIELRKKNNWSKEELATKLGVSRQAISKFRKVILLCKIKAIERKMRPVMATYWLLVIAFLTGIVFIF